MMTWEGHKAGRHNVFSWPSLGIFLDQAGKNNRISADLTERYLIQYDIN